MAAEYEILSIASQKDWRAWLENNHATVDGIWLHLKRKDSRIERVNYDEALDEALCFGWIDGMTRRNDNDSYLQKFTPRRPKSLWSKRNIERVKRLKNEGKMTAAGHAEVEKAQADGRWDAAYAGQSTMEISDEFLAELKKNKKAENFFNTLNRSQKYAIFWRLHNLRTEAGRKKSMASIVDKLQNQNTV